jgi:folate-dependent phosphoribosylglycinamide formyltransferase PurN
MPTGRVLQLGFLASHRGTNMQAILDACKTGRLQARPRVLQQEHMLYVRTLQRIATGEIELQGL